MKTFLLTGCLFISLLAAGQANRGTIAVKLAGPTGEAVENATVELRKAADSSLVKTALSDRNGQAELEGVRYGTYFCRATLVNHSITTGAAFELSQPRLELPVFKSTLTGTQLGGVTVTGRKPFIQKLADRIVVNVENSIVNTGSAAMDVLERSPGVLIDQNDVISLRGRAGVSIMIDGKPTPMTGADLANYLRGLPASAIDRIEIITNPSAKYDAAGNSGIIDIRLKKDQRTGVNGTFNAGYGQGVYPKTNAGASLNYRNKKVNVFGNYNYSYRIGLNHLYLDRNFYENGVYSGGDLKENYSKSPVGSHTARAGADFFPSSKTIIGFVVSSNFNHFTRTNSNSSLVIDDLRQVNSRFASRATNNDHNKNAIANVNFKHRFDSTGKELTADIDYGVFRSHSLTGNSTRYYKNDGTQLQPDYTLNGDQDGKLTLKTGKIDYVHPLTKGAKWEAGLKTSFVSSQNDAVFLDLSSGLPQNDTNKTNNFSYRENNNAAYLNFSKAFSKWDVQLGLRGEHTHIRTKQQIGNVSFDSSYFQLFPSAFINYKLKEDKTLGLSVSRRIDRPGYSQLNPFLFLIDPTTYSTGRPGLLPQITWNYELSYTLKSLSFSLSYSHTKNNQNIAIVRFKDAFPNIPSADNVTVQVPINLASSDNVGLSIAAPVRISKWWNMINNANIYYEKFNGQLGGTTLNNGRPVADIRTNNNFTFKKGWSAELNASLNTGGQYGFMKLDPQWALGAGVQKTVLKNKGMVRFSITDIFWTNLPKAVITYNNYVEKWHAQRETRVANISFSYRFGNSKVQAARRRTTASEEERQRAQ
jgi:iron complex outermembrane recepter protein